MAGGQCDLAGREAEEGGRSVEDRLLKATDERMIETSTKDERTYMNRYYS